MDPKPPPNSMKMASYGVFFVGPKRMGTSSQSGEVSTTTLVKSMGTLDSQEMQVDLAGDNDDFSVADVAWVILYTLSYYFIFNSSFLILLKFRTAEGSTSMHFHPFCFHFPCGKDYEWQESTKSPLEISALLGSWATDWSWSGDRRRWIWWVSQDLGYGMDMDI